RIIFKIRRKFVKKVSLEILEELLDHLEEDLVLNDSETKDILERNPTTEEKARALIDAVKPKGNEACQKMIEHLQTCDIYLSCELGLSSDPSAQKGHGDAGAYPSILTGALQKCQSELKSALKKKFQCVFEGIAKAGNPTLLNQIYTENKKRGPQS
ncbi:caspase-1-like, partial [Melanotaenia boesemani]